MINFKLMTAFFRFKKYYLGKVLSSNVELLGVQSNVSTNFLIQLAIQFKRIYSDLDITYAEPVFVRGVDCTSICYIDIQLHKTKKVRLVLLQLDNPKFHTELRLGTIKGNNECNQITVPINQSTEFHKVYSAVKVYLEESDKR